MCKYANISDSYSLCFIYYWSIVDLQCASLCCTATWLRCSDIHILFQHSFPLWFITEFWIQFPVLYIRTLFIHSKCNTLHLARPLDCKEVQPVCSEGDQPWDFFGRNDAKAEAPVLWPPHAKSWLIGKDSDSGRDWEQEEKGTTQDEMAGWHHGLDGRESEWTLGDGDRQGGLACFDSWRRKESDMTERLNWTEPRT